MAVKKATTENFKDVKGAKYAFVDFFATWCAPCSMIAPIVEKVSGDYPQVEFYKVDIDENMELADEYHVMSIPTLLLLKDGQPAGEIVGYVPEEELRSIIEKTFA